VAAASAVALAVAAACHKDATGPTVTHRTSLLALAHFDSAPPTSPRTFSFKAGLLSTFQLVHSDSVGSAFASFTFTPHSVVTRNDTLLADTSTVIVTVTVVPGTYEFVLGPASLGFSVSSKPTLDFSYTRYANPAVFDSSTRYGSAAAFQQALGLWFERGADRWVQEPNAHNGLTVVSGALEAPGHYLLAAPK
jgi:hypothetical protein